MGISTISFNYARIHGNKMFFTLCGKNSSYTKVFDCNGKNILNRISHRAVKTEKEDSFVISRKNEYETVNNGVFFELKERIYNKSGQLLGTESHMVK